LGFFVPKTAIEVGKNEEAPLAIGFRAPNAEFFANIVVGKVKQVSALSESGETIPASG